MPQAGIRGADSGSTSVWPPPPLGESGRVEAVGCGIHRGRPVAGAVWCAASHALRAGVYHASLGGMLCFNGEAVTPGQNPLIRRRLAGVPNVEIGKSGWEMRTTGSAAIECAFVGAGLLGGGALRAPKHLGCGGGVALVLAARGRVMVAGRRRLEPTGKVRIARPPPALKTFNVPGQDRCGCRRSPARKGMHPQPSHYPACPIADAMHLA